MAVRYKLGRSPRCSLMIDEKSISLEHAIILDYGEYLKIEDISRNGIEVVRHGVKRRLQRRAVETLDNDDILYFGFYDHPFMAFELLAEIKKLRLPMGSQHVRCPIHGNIYISGQKCPECPD